MNYIFFYFFFIVLLITKDNTNKMLIVNIICGIIVGLWLWSLFRSFNRGRIITFLVRLLIGVFILIPILTFVIRRFSKANMMRQSAPVVMMMPPMTTTPPMAKPSPEYPSAIDYSKLETNSF